jgi:oxygen-independent coproporphyrinogen III oxidase
MTSLRTQWGCDLSKIEAEWGKDSVLAIKASSQPFMEKNWLLLRENRLLLTLSGKLFADHIAASLFV